jgi:hypothetical protein
MSVSLSIVEVNVKLENKHKSPEILSHFQQQVLDKKKMEPLFN